MCVMFCFIFHLILIWNFFFAKQENIKVNTKTSFWIRVIIKNLLARDYYSKYIDYKRYTNVQKSKYKKVVIYLPLFWYILLSFYLFLEGTVI